jgi:hypothetical protein
MKIKAQKVVDPKGVSFVLLDGSSGHLPPGHNFRNAILQQ